MSLLRRGDGAHYLAFISYRHSESSRRQAERLESALKAYAKPLWKPPIALFRDERVLRPGDSLKDEIRRALEQSEYLLYLANKEAAESLWVIDELLYWCGSLKRSEQLIIVHIGDRISVDDISREIQWDTTDALPQVLQAHINRLPVWTELSWATTIEQQDLNNVDYKREVNALVARFRGLLPGEMNDEQVLTHRRNMRVRNLGIAALVVLAGVALWSAGRARREQAAAVASAQRAVVSEKQALTNLALANEQREQAEAQRKRAVAASDEAQRQTGIAVENRQLADANATRADLRGRAALALAELPSQPTHALRLSLSAVRDSVKRFGDVTPDLQFSLASSLLGAREISLASIGLLPTSLSAPSDGSVLAVGSLDLVKLVSPDGVLLAPPIAGEDGVGLHVNALSFSPDGRFFATASGLRDEDWNVRIWDRRGQLVAGPLTGHGAPVSAIAFSPDAQSVASAGQDGSLRLWRRDGSLMWSNPTAHKGAINAVAFTDGGVTIVTGGGVPAMPVSTEGTGNAENAIRLWSTSSGAQAASRLTDSSVIAIAAGTDRIVSGGADGLLRVWDFDLKAVAAGRGHSGAIRAVALDESRRLVATGGDDGRVGIWNLAGELLSPLQSGHGSPITAVQFVGPERSLVSLGEDATLRTWRLDEPLIARLSTSRTPDAVALVGRRGVVIVASGAETTVAEGPGSGARLLADALANDESPTRVAMSQATGARAVATQKGLLSGRVFVGDAKQPLRDVLHVANAPVNALAFHPSGREFVVAAGLPGITDRSISTDNGFWLFSTDGKQIAGPVHLGEATPTAATYSPDGLRLFVGDSQGTVHLFDRFGRRAGQSLRIANDGNQLTSLVRALVTTPDGRTLAVAIGPQVGGIAPSVIVLWRLGESAPATTLRGHNQRVNAVAFDDSGRILASGGGDIEIAAGRRDYSIHLWDADTGAALSPPFLGHEAPISDLAFSSRDGFLDSLDSDGTLLQWQGNWKEWAAAAGRRDRPRRAKDDAELLNQQAEQLVKDKNWGGALALYSKALALTPDDADIHWRRSQMLITLGRLDEAVVAQGEAISRSPFNGLFLFERGKLRRRLGNTRGALADFTASLDLAPFIIRPAPVVSDFPWTRLTYDTAVKLSRIAVADVRHHRAESFLSVGDVAAASADASEAFRLGLQSPDLYLLRARIRRTAGDLAGALEDEREAASRR